MLIFFLILTTRTTAATSPTITASAMGTGHVISLDGHATNGIHNIAQLCLTRPDYKLDPNSIPMPGVATTVQELLFITSGIGDKLLKGKHLGPNKPSITSLSRTDPAHNVTIIRSTLSPDLFLTPEMLQSQVVVTGSLWASLRTWAEDVAPDPINENRITTAILKPLFLVWLKVWTEAAVDPETQSLEWNARSVDPSEGGGDVDILLTKYLEGKLAAVEVAAVEAKTPLSCGHQDIVNFGKSGDLKDDALSRQCIRHLTRCNKSSVDHSAPWSGSSTLGALTVYPGHFFPVAYRDDNRRFVVFPDVAHVKDDWPETRDKFENHMKASSIAAAWAFMVVVTADAKYRQRWAELCPKQVDQAAQWAATAGEQLASPNRLLATLTRCWSVVSTLIYQTVFLLLVTLVPLRRFRAIVLPNGDRIAVKSGDYRLPLDITLPPPDKVHQSHTAQTFIFSSPNVVVKVYDDVEPYAHELAFYEKWGRTLGSAIPKLCAKGRCIDGSKPLLIFSNEGEPLPDLTDEDRAIVQRTVLDVIHAEGWHHHDFAARNVLRKPSGGLCLIDFGMAAKCDRGGCDAL